MNSGVINKDNLATAGGFNAQQADSGCLRFVRDDGNFLTDEIIKQSGFASIGATD